MKNSDVLYLARLSNLTLTDEETNIIARDLTQTLEAVKTLTEIDTKTVSATFQTSGNSNRFQQEKTGERCLAITKPFIVTTHYLEP